MMVYKKAPSVKQGSFFYLQVNFNEGQAFLKSLIIEGKAKKRETRIELATLTLGRLHSTIELLPRFIIRYMPTPVNVNTLACKK